MKLGIRLRRRHFLHCDLNAEPEDKRSQTSVQLPLPFPDARGPPSPPPETPRPKRQCVVRIINSCDPSNNHTRVLGLATPDGSKMTSKASQVTLPEPSSPTLAIRTLQRRQSRDTLIPTTQQWSSSSTGIELPIIDFRGYSEEKSQGLNSPQSFRAGSFLDAARIPTCPTVTEPEFIAEANTHCAWTKGHPSRFISVTTSCIRAMMKARSPKTRRYLAVLDLHKIQQSGSIFSADSLHLKPTRPDGSAVT